MALIKTEIVTSCKVLQPFLPFLRAAHPHPIFLEVPLRAFFFCRILYTNRGSFCQAFLTETMETGTKNRCVIEATHVLRRKLWKD